MFKPRQFKFASSVSVAVLSACCLAPAAHAGLLGGGGGGLGGVGGGLGGGFHGGFAPRNLDLAGQANGQASRNGAPLPTAGRARDAVSSATDAAGAAKPAPADGTASPTPNGQAAAPQSAPAPAAAAANSGATVNGAATGNSRALAGNASTTGSTRHANASANAAVQASRDTHSISADGGTQVEVQR